MRKLLTVGVSILTLGSFISSFTGCVSQQDSKPTSFRVKPRVGSKGTEPVLPVVVSKAVPTASPSPLAKSARKISARSKSVPVGVSIPFTYSIAPAVWPANVDHVDANVRCYEVGQVTAGSITTAGSALPVFSGSSTPSQITITHTTSPTVNATFSSTYANKQLVVEVTGVGDDGETEYFFGGADIFIVNPQ